MRRPIQNKSVILISEIGMHSSCVTALCAVLDNPELRGKPLAVSHSASAKGAGEVSSASYEARAMGVRAGMFMESAKALCPGLVVMPYEFEKYEAISEQARSFAVCGLVPLALSYQTCGDVLQWCICISECIVPLDLTI